MTKKNFKTMLKISAFILIILAITSCNSGNKSDAQDSLSKSAEEVSIPDTIVQFLITSASADFRNHQPPTAIDFRNIKIGYLTSPNNGKTFIMCGEFLSREEKVWNEFTTIKTSGYEQYLGKTMFCQEAIMVLTGDQLAAKLKNNLIQ